MKLWCCCCLIWSSLWKEGWWPNQGKSGRGEVTIDCEASDTMELTVRNNKLTFGTGAWLKVELDVQDPDPSVYQMRSPKTGRTVCLFTDFDSQADFQKPEGATVISLNSTVLDMKVMDSKSNGALTWNSETNIECKENFQQPFYPSSNYSCDAKLIEKSFETDMDLNFYNLLVIGLRILLLKVIGFNLFMTLRLWSC